MPLPTITPGNAQGSFFIASLPAGSNTFTLAIPYSGGNAIKTVTLTVHLATTQHSLVSTSFGTLPTKQSGNAIQTVYSGPVSVLELGAAQTVTLSFTSAVTNFRFDYTIA